MILPNTQRSTWRDDDDPLIEDRVEVGVDVDGRRRVLEVRQSHERLVENVVAKSENLENVR